MSGQPASDATVRAWALAHGVPVSAHGFVSVQVRRAYFEAQAARPVILGQYEPHQDGCPVTTGTVGADGVLRCTCTDEPDEGLGECPECGGTTYYDDVTECRTCQDCPWDDRPCPHCGEHEGDHRRCYLIDTL